MDQPKSHNVIEGYKSNVSVTHIMEYIVWDFIFIFMNVFYNWVVKV